MKDYIFPFDTCEIPYRTNSIIAQPYSFVVNLISSCILLYAAFTTKDIYIKVFFGLLFLFEFIHTGSHFTHIPGKIQITTIHFVAYMVNFSYFAIFIHLTKRIPSYEIMALYVLIILLDIVFFYKNKFIGYFITQISLLVLINLYYFNYITENISYYYLITFFILVVILILLFINEQENCKKMLDNKPLPYHIIVETVGVLIFSLYVIILKQLDK